MLLEESQQSCPGFFQILGAVQLNHNAAGLVLAATVNQVLGQPDIHAHIVVVELLERLHFNPGDSKRHYIRGPTRSCSQEIDDWFLGVRVVCRLIPIGQVGEVRGRSGESIRGRVGLPGRKCGDWWTIIQVKPVAQPKDAYNASACNSLRQIVVL